MRTREAMPQVQFSRIERWAHTALLEEVYTTPKPGLVDLHDNGAHVDMNCATFEASAAAIAPYFAQMAWAGWQAELQPESLFAAIRGIGQSAEHAMFRSTGGINTHKGALFTLGILCAAAGRCLSSCGCIRKDMVLTLGQDMARETLEKELRQLRLCIPKTHGELLYQKYGVRGVRGEVIDGFPTLRAMDALLDCFGKTEIRKNEVKVQALLVSMARLEDTNVLMRGGPQAAVWVKRTAEELLEQGGAFSKQGRAGLREMNRQCIRKNISPGGSADLLAAALFLRHCQEVWEAGS